VTKYRTIGWNFREQIEECVPISVTHLTFCRQHYEIKQDQDETIIFKGNEYNFFLAIPVITLGHNYDKIINEDNNIYIRLLYGFPFDN